MPWHAPLDAASSLTREVSGLWSTFDHDAKRHVHVPSRREALRALGASDSTAAVAAEWSRDEATAVRKAFERFDDDGDNTIDSKELATALKLLGLTASTAPAQHLLAKFDVQQQEHSPWSFARALTRPTFAHLRRQVNSNARLELGEFRKLVSHLRRLEREAPPLPSASPSAMQQQQRAASRPTTPTARRTGGGVARMSADDGGGDPGTATSAASLGTRPTASSIGGSAISGTAVGGGGMALNESAVDLEINHVRRQLLGRAFRTQTTTRAVVHEHQIYREGLQRALDGQRTAWELTLLDNRALAQARSVARSHWRPSTAGPGNRSKRQQINVNPYYGPEGEVATAGLPKSNRGYTPMSKDKLEEWVAKVDRLQRKCGDGSTKR